MKFNTLRFTIHDLRGREKERGKLGLSEDRDFFLSVKEINVHEQCDYYQRGATAQSEKY